MEVLINSKSDVEHLIEIVVPNPELQPHFDRAYREEGRKLSIPGFRPGKTPLAIIKKRFGEAIEYQVIEKLANDLFRQSMEERNLQPIGAPELETLDYAPGGTLTIKVHYQTAPEIVARDYKGLQLEHYTHDLTDDEVEEEITALRKAHRTLVPADVADEEGYLVTCDIQMMDNEGNPISDRKYDAIKIDMGDEGVNRDLKAELLNMKTGEEKDVELTFTTSAGAEESEKAHITVHSIERIVLPELDDAFAKKASNERLDTMDALRADIRTYLEKSWSERYDRMLQDEIVEQIIKHNPFEVPQVVVKEILDGFVEEVKNRSKDKTLPADFDEKAYREQRSAEAMFVAKWMFLRDSIIAQEHIALTDEDLEHRAEQDATRLGIAKEHLLDFYKKSPERAESIRYEKLMTFLRENAEIRKADDNDLGGTAMAPFADTHDHHHDHDHDHDHGHDHDHDHDHDHSDPEETKEDTSKG